ncbi:hypothetical protein GCM10007036_13870 [Alsobacter metallidurans]|uniref:HNH endonuclease n=1 Tax=Alsobacter metallidurans TaxID=340221 RepID=A0A917MJ08_9HYPH|nr:hypothetical protein [Alsobacter metallidurans]GGH14506.1 hypothetical protein GCM10007036_13870 [Alsobacter metallidurans]
MSDLGHICKRRKGIPDKVKLLAVLRQNGKCAHCGDKLGELAGLNFDHRPALAARLWIAENCDFDPPQLDPAFIEAVHRDCHDIRTYGPGGEKRIHTRGSDQGERARVRGISEAYAAFQRRLLAKTAGDEEPPPARSRKAKQRIPSRPFASAKRPIPSRSRTP